MPIRLYLLDEDFLEEVIYFPDRDVNPVEAGVQASSLTGYITLKIVINNNWLGHTGLTLGTGDDGILYDPGGSFGGYSRPSNDIFWGEYDFEKYLDYQRDDGPKVAVYEFNMPAEQAMAIRKSIMELGGVSPFFCAQTISTVLRDSGGIFDQLPFSSTPWGLELGLQRLKRRGLRTFKRTLRKMKYA